MASSKVEARIRELFKEWPWWHSCGWEMCPHGSPADHKVFYMPNFLADNDAAVKLAAQMHVVAQWYPDGSVYIMGGKRGSTLGGALIATLEMIYSHERS